MSGAPCFVNKTLINVQTLKKDHKQINFGLTLYLRDYIKHQANKAGGGKSQERLQCGVGGESSGSFSSSKFFVYLTTLSYNES